MFSLSEKVFVWLVLAVSATVPWLPGHRTVFGCGIERCPVRTGCGEGIGFLQGLGRESFFPSSCIGALPSSPIPFWDLQKSCFAFPSSPSPAEVAFFPIPLWCFQLAGKGTTASEERRRRKGKGREREGKERKYCRAGTEKWNQTLVRRVPRAGGRMQWCSRAELTPGRARHISPSPHRAVGCTG